MTVALANAVLVAHAFVVLFIVGGFVLVWVGAWRGWQWVRTPAFRAAHLGAIAFVAILSILDIPCPLTTLEGWLRRDGAGNQGFIAYWVGRLLYYDLPGWVFTAVYVLFALVVLLTWRFVPPRARR